MIAIGLVAAMDQNHARVGGMGLYEVEGSPTVTDQLMPIYVHPKLRNCLVLRIDEAQVTTDVPTTSSQSLDGCW